MNANKAVFLYGSPGNGKTVIGEGLGRAIGGDMYMPYALDVDGYIVTMYDPITHESLETESAPSSIIAEAQRDRRWVRIRRPVVIVGGELTLDMLDLTFNKVSKFYEAPLQLKSNGGVFLVDDFGRQRMRPEDLLNRWIVPLESRVDYLTLHTGKKFQIPFDVLTVFATNLDPLSLADEAFLRRIPYKIEIEDPTLQQFARIFEMVCDRRELKFHPVMVAYLHRRHYRPVSRPLRACQPRDLIEQVTALCHYRGEEPRITRELLDAACAAYFVDDTTGSQTNSRLRRRDAQGSDGTSRQRRRPHRHRLAAGRSLSGGHARDDRAKRDDGARLVRGLLRSGGTALQPVADSLDSPSTAAAMRPRSIRCAVRSSAVRVSSSSPAKWAPARACCAAPRCRTAGRIRSSR